MTYHTSPMERAMASDPMRDEEHVHLVDPNDVKTVLKLGSLGSLASVENYAQSAAVLPASALIPPENL